MNVTRDYLGGITISNINLLNFLHGTGRGVMGIELNGRRYIHGATAFWHFSPDWFEHHIINIHDIPIMKQVNNSKNIKELESRYRPTIKLIKKILMQERPDVVLLNGTYYMPWILSIAAKELKIPIVLRYAGVLSRETAGLKPKARKIFQQMEKSFEKRVDSFIFPSELCKKVVEEEVYKYAVNNAFVIPNPVTIPDTIPAVRSVERRIAAIGRWDYIKNFQAYFEIHKILKKQKWEHSASFVTGTAKITRMPKSIHRVAQMSPSGISDFYKSQGLIICPSFFETFGNVPMEAACLGIPVLVNENMGCAEILKLAGLGKMVMPFDDLKKVAERAKELCGQHILPKQLNNLKKYLDPKVINEQMVAVIRETAGF
ncbi:MAG: Glycosyl transferase group 1 [Parcubacteria group bacterium GW2011_GWF2_38_76]|nr:MAG: Glycosyl transferase group 1 [Parcubacteria group bacterium GW2011_GWF2_38_76]